ncbi:MAG: hypothetical protein QM737_22685 [Ferruginibacter sp.]
MNYKWKGTAGWLQAKGRSDVLEDQLKESLEKIDGCTVITSQHLGAFSDWDLKLTYPSGITVTVEVKEDKRCLETGNVAVELYRVKSNGEVRKTCISVSKADYFAYYLGEGQFYFIKTSALRELLQNRDLYYETFGGDGGTARNAIFKREIIEGIAEFIYPITK